MNTFLEKFMVLGAMEDRACSDTEIKLIKNEAEELYNNHLAELKVLNIDDVSVIDLIRERRQYILDEIWSCEEIDLTDAEVDALDEKMDRDMSVLQWFYSR